MWRKYNDKLFKNNQSKDQEASEIVRLLEIAENDSNKLFVRKKKYELGKHLKHVEALLEILQDWKYEGQERMVADDEEDEAVNVGKRYELLEERLAWFDGFIAKLKKELSIVNDRKEAEARRNKDLIEEERFRGRMEEEVKIEEIKMEMKKKSFKFNSNDILKSEKKVRINIVLKITKFDGTTLDWFRLWNQFKTEIDQVQISPISPFSYLKELLIPKVSLLIDEPPFTSEGYTRAKLILTSWYVNQVRLLLPISIVYSAYLLFGAAIVTVSKNYAKN